MIKLELQLFGGRGSGGGRSGGGGKAGGAKTGGGKPEAKEEKDQKQAEALVDKLSSMKNPKNVGKYMQTPEQREEILRGMKEGDLMGIDYKDKSGNIRSLDVQKGHDGLFYVGFQNDMVKGTREKATIEMENRLKGMDTSGRGGLVSRGWGRIQHMPYDYFPDRPVGKKVVERPNRVKKL